MKMISTRSYKRKMIWVIVIMVCIGILYRTFRERNLYVVYLDDKPIAVTVAKPETVLKTYGNVKAMRYIQGKEEIQKEIIIEKLDESANANIKVLNNKELTEKLYLTLDEQEPVLTGMKQQYYTNLEPYCAPCEYIYDDEMYVGESEIVCEGCEGTKEITVLSTYFNDDEITKKPIDSEIIEEAVPKVVHIGTKDRPEYVMPVDGYTFTSGFGERWGRNHNGVDLAVPVGTDIHAAADGVIIQSGWYGGYGICVDIDHGNGVVTRYAHMSRNDAYVGEYVKQGDIIGLSGNTGNSTGPHVHFEIRINETAVNPLDYAEEVIIW